MKRPGLTLLLAAGLAVPLSVSAQETPYPLFRVAGLRVTNLLSTVNKVAVVCSAIANTSSSSKVIGWGMREFTPVPLADISLGRGVISGPFEVVANYNYVQSSTGPTLWVCKMVFGTTTSSSTSDASTDCTPDHAASKPEVCPKDGVLAVTSHRGNY